MRGAAAAAPRSARVSEEAAGLLPRDEHALARQVVVAGTVPTQLGLLTELKHFEVDYNHVSGTIPTQFGKLSKLSGGNGQLSLAANSLSGSIPSELGKVTAQECYLTLAACYQDGRGNPECNLASSNMFDCPCAARPRPF